VGDNFVFIARALDIHIFKLHPETEGRNKKDLKNALRFYEFVGGTKASCSHASAGNSSFKTSGHVQIGLSPVLTCVSHRLQ